MIDEPQKPTGDFQKTDEGRWLRGRRALKLGLLAAWCVGLALTVFFGSRARALTSGDAPKLSPTALDATEPPAQTGDFSQFTHNNQTHARLPCLLCHRRDDNPVRPRLPGHMPCAGCHSQQFANNASPICTICHTDAAAGAVKPFPALKSFSVRFDHARHMAGASRPGAGCVACHKPARRGVAFSIPSRINAHATCYQCHAPRAQTSGGTDISSCGTCHFLGRLVRTPETARAFSVGFSHANHGANKRLGCNDCHNIRAGMPRSSQVTAPQPLNHHATPGALSCMTCHNGKRAFGGEDFSSCKRCHQGTAWHF